ncbi:MAG TPA: DoxX family protein, partial [Anaerolineales bacterium]
LFWLGTLKAMGAVGLVIGIGLPLIGVAASLGLVLYFIGAVVTCQVCGALGEAAFPSCSAWMV